jgi:hypothetical protein
MYGTEFGVRLSLSANPFRPLADFDGEAAPRPVMARRQPGKTGEHSLFGEIRELLGGESATTAFAASGITRVEIETDANGVRWARAELPASAGYDCPGQEALAIDAEYGVIDAVRFRHPDGKLVCTVALRPVAQQAIRRAVRASAAYPTNWHANEAKRREIVEKLVAEMDAGQLGLFGVNLEPERVTVYIENAKFRSMPRAIGRTARALTATMPASVELFEVVPVEGSLPVISVLLQRSALEDQVERPDRRTGARPRGRMGGRWTSSRVSPGRSTPPFRSTCSTRTARCASMPRWRPRAGSSSCPASASTAPFRSACSARWTRTTPITIRYCRGCVRTLRAISPKAIPRCHA